jgi:hypothetical protein
VSEVMGENGIMHGRFFVITIHTLAVAIGVAVLNGTVLDNSTPGLLTNSIDINNSNSSTK